MSTIVASCNHIKLLEIPLQIQQPTTPPLIPPKISHYSHSITFDPFLILHFERYNIHHVKMNDEIWFKCRKVKQLQSISFTSELITKFIYDIGFLIKCLETHQMAILSFSQDDIIVLNTDTNDNIFMFINVAKILHIKRDMITLNSPIKMDNNSLFSPEIKPFINRLPLKVHYKTAYYSFALLIIQLMCNHEPNIREASDSLNNIPEFFRIHPSLYSFLERCLNPNPDERNFMYI